MAPTARKRATTKTVTHGHFCADYGMCVQAALLGWTAISPCSSDACPADGSTTPAVVLGDPIDVFLALGATEAWLEGWEPTCHCETGSTSTT